MLAAWPSVYIPENRCRRYRKSRHFRYHQTPPLSPLATSAEERPEITSAYCFIQHVESNHGHKRGVLDVARLIQAERRFRIVIRFFVNLPTPH